MAGPFDKIKGAITDKTYRNHITKIKVKKRDSKG